MKLLMAQFKGMAPKFNPTQLPDNFAEVAVDVKFENGCLEPRNGFYIGTADNDGYSLNYAITHQLALDGTEFAQSVHRLFSPRNPWDAWVASTEVATFTSSVSPNDPDDKTFSADSVYPKYYAGTTDAYRLGIPRPVISGVTVNDDGDTTDPLTTETVSYVATFVDDTGAEGPPSDPYDCPSDIGPTHDVDVAITDMVTPPNGFNLNMDAGIKGKIRLYRSAAGTSSADYLYVTEIDYDTTAVITDTVDTSDLQEPCPSETWVGPPNDGWTGYAVDATLWPDGPLQGIINIGNGILAGYTGNTIHFSEPGIPHAWPTSYRIVGDAPIRGLVLINSGVLVITTIKPWLCAGSSPASMVRVPIDSNLNCLNSRSVVSIGGAALWASTNGIAYCDGSPPILISSAILDRNSWAAYQPENLIAVAYRGKYVAAIPGSDSPYAFIFDPVTKDFIELQSSGTDYEDFATGLYGALGTDYVSALDADYPVTGLAYDPVEDLLYFIRGAAYHLSFLGESDREHSVGYAMEYGALTEGTWVSAIYRLPQSRLSAIRVDADDYPVQIQVEIADNIQQLKSGTGFIHNAVITNNGPYRLPQEMYARYWQFSVTVDTQIHSIEVSDNLRELM